MKLLLDTHAFLWWLADDPALSAEARRAIQVQCNTVLVSAASAWEIATKFRLGKLPGIEPVVRRYHDLVRDEGFQTLDITPVHALRAGAYATEYRDPFDRMLAAQAELEGARVVSCDPGMTRFPVPLLW